MAYIKDNHGLGEITFIRPSVIRDIHVLLNYVERWNKKDEDEQAADCAERVETYLRQYLESEQAEDLEIESNRQISNDKVAE